MITPILATGLGLLVGVVAVAWFMRAKAPVRPRIPKEWPLLARPIANSKERQVWVWLTKVMHDQQIMVKLPVTRFTIPAKREGAEQWYDMLNRVYCTFTVCSMDGRVIGCVDVPGSSGLSMSNQTLKYGLLSQCGIPYWVVEPDNLPHINQIRTAFLGDAAARTSAPDPIDLRLKDVADNLHAVVSRQRTHKTGAAADHHDSHLPSGWENNSFVGNLDSRAADLNKQ
jgi:hypothetical protein